MSCLIKSDLFLSNATEENLWKRREHVLEERKQKGRGRRAECKVSEM